MRDPVVGTWGCLIVATATYTPGLEAKAYLGLLQYFVGAQTLADLASSAAVPTCPHALEQNEAPRRAVVCIATTVKC